MLKRVLLAIVVGVITALLVALLGVVLVAVGLADIGGFVKGVAGLVGLLAAVWYFLTGTNPSRL